LTGLIKLFAISALVIYLSAAGLSLLVRAVVQ